MYILKRRSNGYTFGWDCTWENSALINLKPMLVAGLGKINTDCLLIFGSVRSRSTGNLFKLEEV